MAHRRFILFGDLFPIDTAAASASSSVSSERDSPAPCPLVVLVGNPNTGKTALFNFLTGLRAKTANFPGTTVEHRFAEFSLAGRTIQLMDLPGLYCLEAATDEERIARDVILGKVPGLPVPSAVLLLLDATQLERHLFLASQVLELGRPTIVVLTMVDLAARQHIRIDLARLSEELGCSVVAVVATTGEGVDQLLRELQRLLEAGSRAATAAAASTASSSSALSARLRLPQLGCPSCPYAARYQWAETIGSRAIVRPRTAHGSHTEAIDRVLTHPLVGLVVFLGAVFLIFAVIFWIAEYPMAAVDALFSYLGAWSARGIELLAGYLPDDSFWRVFLLQDFRSFWVNAVLGGVGGLLVFLPQICILFFLLSLLEDTGYLARAAFVMDRLTRHVGLPGKAFVPMLAAHACAVPALMSCRVIEDRRDRMITMLMLPMMSCSARIPIYAMLVALLFPAAPLKAAGLFTAAYLLGIAVALLSAAIFRRFVFKGQARPLILELPAYRLPSLRSAFLAAYDRAVVFLRKAGTIILLVSLILWALSHYPRPPASASPDTHGSAAQRMDRAFVVSSSSSSREVLVHSFAGRFGRILEPALKPLGFDWQIGLGILSSFAARESFVSTLAIVYGVGEDSLADNPQGLYATLQAARRSDGSPVFTTPTCLSILVFYVLALQCLATLATLRQQTGSWTWPLLLFLYMTTLAYLASFLTYQLAGAWVT